MDLLLSHTNRRQPDYQYQPLSTEKNCIRLLKVKGFACDGYIDCTLTALEIGSVAYHAVSYVWGEAGPEHQITIDGQAIKVTTNLWLFLRYVMTEMRSEDASYYWCDAICINQHDIVEKSNQVPLMGKVYSLAQSVLTWLPTGFNMATTLPSQRKYSWSDGASCLAQVLQDGD